MHSNFGSGLSGWQIAALATSFAELSSSLRVFGLSPSTERQLHRSRKAAVEMFNGLTIREYGPPDEKGIRHAVQRPKDAFSDRELKIHDLLRESLRSIVLCLSKKRTPSETGEELESLAAFAKELAGESGSDLPANIGTVTDDMRELAADVALLGRKAPSVVFRAGYISWALAAIYGDVACEAEEISRAHSRARLKRSLTAEESTTKDIVGEAMRLLDGISDHKAKNDCAERLHEFADRLDRRPEIARYQDAQSPGAHDASDDALDRWIERGRQRRIELGHATGPRDELSHLRDWSKRLERWLAKDQLPDDLVRMIFRPHRGARNGMMPLSVQYPHIIGQIQSDLEFAEQWYERLSEGRSAAENLWQAIHDLNERILTAVSTIERAQGKRAISGGQPNGDGGPFLTEKEEMKKRFSFYPGQVLFDGRDLEVPSGAPSEVLEKLVDSFGCTVPYTRLDPHYSSAVPGSLPKAVTKIRKAFRAHNVPCELRAKRGEGYVIRELEPRNKRGIKRG